MAKREAWTGTFGDYVREVRRLAGERDKTQFYQRDLADKLGVSVNTIARWETDTEKLRREAIGLSRMRLTRFARALGLPDPPARPPTPALVRRRRKHDDNIPQDSTPSVDSL